MPDSLEALADSLDIATADGHLPNPAEKVSLANQNDQDSSAFVRTIRHRLIALGYLGSARKNKTRRIIRRDGKLETVSPLTFSGNLQFRTPPLKTKTDQTCKPNGINKSSREHWSILILSLTTNRFPCRAE